MSNAEHDGLGPRWASPTTIRFPVMVLQELDAHVQVRGTNRSELFVAIAREWLEAHRGELETAPSQPGLF